MVPETGIEPVRPLFTKRRILSPLCLPISPLGLHMDCQTKKPLFRGLDNHIAITLNNIFWRRGPESNRASRICNPVHNRFVTAPCFLHWKKSVNLQAIACYLFDCSNRKGQHFRSAALLMWSGRRVSNSRPQPWQGCALPTELLPHFKLYIITYFRLPLRHFATSPLRHFATSPLRQRANVLPCLKSRLQSRLQSVSPPLSQVPHLSTAQAGVQVPLSIPDQSI